MERRGATAEQQAVAIVGHISDTDFVAECWVDIIRTVCTGVVDVDYITTMPDEIGGFFAFLNVPPGPPFPEAWHAKSACGIVWCCTYPHQQAEAALAPRRKRFPPAIDFVGPLPYPASQSMFDPLHPPGLQWYWRADFVNELS